MRKDWEVKKLGDVCYSLNGLWTGKNPPFVSVSVIRNTNFSKDCKLVLNDVAIIEVERNQYLSRKLIYGDIIIEKSGGSDKQPVGRPVIFKVKEGEYSFSNFTSTLRVVDKDIVYPDFLYYQLKFYYFDGRTLKMQTKTTGLRNLQLNAYLNQRILLPPLQTQQQIVEELDSLASIIEKQKKQLEELDNLAQSIFYDMFGDPIENEKEWNIVKFRDIGNVQGGYAFKSSSFVDYGIPVLKIGNINSGFFKKENISFYKYDSTLKKYEIYPNDLVISMTGTVGKDDYGNICIIPFDYELYYLNQRNAKLIVSDSYNSLFLSYVLKDNKIKRELTKNSKGVRQANISNNDILNLNLISPPLPLQQQFASKIEAIEKQKELIKKSIKETEDLFNSRMDYYFN
jgi:type I restriction enzyme S subunit